MAPNAVISTAPGGISDWRRMEQMLLNLLNNTIKFTDHGSVALTADIAADFQPFRQVDTTGLTRQHEGVGLGPAICRRHPSTKEPHDSHPDR